MRMAEYWFRPKERGIGAGVPLNWKGWALFGSYVAVIVSVPSLFELTLGYPGTVLQRILVRQFHFIQLPMSSSVPSLPSTPTESRSYEVVLCLPG